MPPRHTFIERSSKISSTKCHLLYTANGPGNYSSYQVWHLVEEILLERSINVCLGGMVHYQQIIEWSFLSLHFSI
jgi:hypothetical protein